jgi:hypothetical protein
VNSRVAVDIDGDARPLSQSDLGADEVGFSRMIYLPLVLKDGSR